MDLSQAWEQLKELGDSAIRLLPNVGIGILVFAVFVVLAKVLRAGVRRANARRGDHALGIALGRVVQGGAILIGLLVAVTVIFPTFRPGDLITLLGISGVAIGFIFKDLFQNFLAGILLLVTRPFRVGDQIVFGAFEGTVEEIQTRATFLKTYDGRRVVIPNAELFVNSVTVNTAFEIRRNEYDIGIGVGDDIARAKAIILDVLERAEDVLPDPKADVIVIDLAESSVNLRARWWSSSRMPDFLIGRDRVLEAVKARLIEEGIDLPYPTRQILFHDQTEETDGDRRRQREGWPPGDGVVPRPRSIGGALAGLAARRDDVADTDGGRSTEAAKSRDG